MNNATLGNAFNSRNKQTTQLKFPENITIQDKKPDANVNRTSFHTPTQLQQLHCTECTAQCVAQCVAQTSGNKRLIAQLSDYCSEEMK